MSLYHRTWHERCDHLPTFPCLAANDGVTHVLADESGAES